MAYWSRLAAVVLLCSCTKPNPLDCSDGLCSDPAYPFCDVDGSFGGTTNTCVAVSCTAGETAACRGDVAIVCNATGNDYDLISCERGCDPMYGCRQCTSNAECANPSPVCDATSSSCRACKLDDECTSKVCENGTCLAEAGILYAAPNGSDTSACTLIQPCGMQHALTLAVSGPTPPLIRLLPGVYADALNVTTPTNAPIRIVGSGATLAGQIPIQVGDGAAVEIRSIAATGSNVVLTCSSSTTNRSMLSVSDGIIQVGSSSAGLVQLGKCDLTLKSTELDIGASTGSGISLSSNAVLVADRTHWHGNGSTNFSVGAFGTLVGVKVTNSVLDRVFFVWTTTDTTSPGSSISMGFNTILEDQFGLNCQTNSGSAYRTSHYENNIIVASNTASAVDGTDCALAHNVLYPFTGAAGTNLVADPQFVDAASRNYHLKDTSPAIDAAVPSGFSLATPDYDGTLRPQGAQPDIGAFELKP